MAPILNLSAVNFGRRPLGRDYDLQRQRAIAGYYKSVPMTGFYHRPYGPPPFLRHHFSRFFDPVRHAFRKLMFKLHHN